MVSTARGSACDRATGECSPRRRKSDLGRRSSRKNQRHGIAELALGLLMCFTLGGCGLLPSAAPTAGEFSGPGPDPNFLMLDLDAELARAVSNWRPSGLASSFSSDYKPGLILRSGDTISMTVYEVTPLPLFGGGDAGGSQNLPVGGHVATIPTVVIDLDGTVPMPFGGHVKVAGLTPAQAGAALAKALEGKATNPQVVVSLVSSVVDSASVNGEVGHPGLIALTIRGERLLDVVAAAGGAQHPPYDSEVQLVRAGRVAKSSLARVLQDPHENVTVRPGDSIYVIFNPRTFTVMGSADKVAQYDFNTEKVDLAEAVARAGGLNDTTASISDVYLLRFEPKEIAPLIRPILDRRGIAPRAPASDGTTPIVYHLDLRRAEGYFVSQLMQMRDKDVVLEADAASVQFSKLLTILRGMSGIYYDFHSLLGPTTTAATAVRTTTTVVTTTKN